MLKWKTYTFTTIGNGVQSLTELLSGAQGKNRVIMYFTAPNDVGINARIYLDADQAVDFDCNLITTAAPLIPVNLPVAVGVTAHCGFYNLSAGDVTPSFTIGYEETG